jgi:hypothetical protein
LEEGAQKNAPPKEEAMENWLLLVEANCKDAKRLTEFDEWYDTIHIPDIITGSPGFRSATRYMRKYPAPGRGAYLAVYEIETEDIEKTMEAHRKNLEEKYGKGRSSDLIEVVSRRLCKVA